MALGPLIGADTCTVTVSVNGASVYSQDLSLADAGDHSFSTMVGSGNTNPILYTLTLYDDGSFNLSIDAGAHMIMASGTSVRLTVAPTTKTMQDWAQFQWNSDATYANGAYSQVNPPDAGVATANLLWGDSKPADWSADLYLDGDTGVPGPPTAYAAVNVPSDATFMAMEVWKADLWDIGGFGGGVLNMMPLVGAGTPPPGGCFWTDFIGCVEDCGGTPIPPVDEGVFNARTWNMDYVTGCCSGADKSCVQTDGLKDSFGDVPAMAEMLAAPGGTGLSPTMGVVNLLVPMRCISRGTPPSCTSTLPAPKLRATFTLTPPAGGTADWDLIGAYNTVPYIDMTAGLYNSPDGTGSPVLTGNKGGDMLRSMNDDGTLWYISAELDFDLSDPAMPDTENASIVLALTYTGTMTTGTPVVVQGTTLNVEAQCPC